MVRLGHADGLEKLSRVLGYQTRQSRIMRRRIKVAIAELIVFSLLFVASVVMETTVSAMMLSFLQIEVLGHVASGAIYALLVPFVMAAAHIKLHSESDWFTQFWVRRLSTIGIFFFAVGFSVMAAFAAWQAAEDTIANQSGGISGTLGGSNLTAQPSSSTGWAEQIASIPNVLLFLGLASGMIITIYFASFCLGRVIQALMLLTEGPRIERDMVESIASTRQAITDLRRLLSETEVKRRRAPLDPQHSFAREAAHTCWDVAQKKLAVANRKFAATLHAEPLGTAFRDKEAETIPIQFTSSDSFAAHMADQMDAMRVHHMLRVLSGAERPTSPSQGDN